MNSIKRYCLILKLLLMSCGCGIGFSDVAKSDMLDKEFKDLSSNVKLAKSVFRICDKIVIYHSLYGEVEFTGELLKSLVIKLDKLAFDEWWCTGFLTKGRSEWPVVIECFVRKEGDEGKYETFALFPLNATVLKDAGKKQIDNLLPQDIVNKGKNHKESPNHERQNK